jgi:hypothetical protein
MAAFVPHRPNKILPRDSVQRNCFEFALYATRDHDCISNRIGSGIRTCPRCGCRLATFGALPTPSTIYREIIMLNNHRFWGHASGPSSSSGKTRSSFHPLLARPCRSALPRERFSPMRESGRGQGVLRLPVMTRGLRLRPPRMPAPLASRAVCVWNRNLF